ncbi:ABC transporter ATP-binding protein [Chondromyces apiculatus]|uniref:ABC-type nitrate/sulfonate/bicarbonate transport system, ATPase component n=1 Tax=Chondromyces apiculatus DSM 436 TaxID=1192034 RepID=A0A017TIA3_9BACT|nr:ABC transporter ATP-binding protein [Chondromyces apiculatus]EYF08545.1 ABC-type nitrate/sulfonate/bicarbonate transport system, ATPase component [Chondromyces apiculatus DSM 436]
MGEASPSRERGVRVQIAGVRRTFEGEGGEVPALAGIDLDIAAGSFVALLGPSGCGKSTLLRLIAGLDRADAGTIRVSPEADAGGATFAGGVVRSAATSTAFVFQDAHLLPWRSVLDNTALPLELAGVDAATRHAAAREELSRVGLSDAEARTPAELSGGMRMRVSLARALITRPRLLLLDEPFAALDELTRGRLDDQLRALWAELGMTVIFVTHSITEAAYLAERAVVLTPRPARIVLDRTLDLPTARAATIRLTPELGREVQVLQEALERGGA